MGKTTVHGHGRDQWDVTGDGQSVRVNGRTGCLGFFCKAYYEVFYEYGHTTNQNNNLVRDWDRFVDEMAKHHKVVLDDTYRPEYTKPEGYV